MTRGHEAAVREVEAWLRARVPHAIVVSGPTRVGKMTLAFDLAARLAQRPVAKARHLGRSRHAQHLLERRRAGERLR